MKNKNSFKLINRRNLNIISNRIQESNKSKFSKDNYQKFLFKTKKLQTFEKVNFKKLNQEPLPNTDRFNEYLELLHTRNQQTLKFDVEFVFFFINKFLLLKPVFWALLIISSLWILRTGYYKFGDLNNLSIIFPEPPYNGEKIFLFFKNFFK